MSIALDIGTAMVKSLRREGPRLIIRQCPSMFAALPNTQQNLELVQSKAISYAVCRDEIVVIGDAVRTQADLRLVQPLFPEGVMQNSAVLERQILAQIIEAVLPKPRVKNEICGLNIPQNIEHQPQRLTQEQNFLLNLVELRGYQPLLCNAGMAIVLSECESSGYTGLGISFGKHYCQISLLKTGRQIATCQIPAGGSWLDGKLSQHQELLAEYWDSSQVQNLELVQQHREAFAGSLLVPDTLFEHVLADLTQELLNIVMQELQRLLQGQSFAQTIPTAIPVVCAGGLTLMKDFMAVLQMHWDKFPLPFTVNCFRRARRPLSSICQGCLVNAELETITLHQSGAA